MNAYQNPFVGLRAFESDESLLFFGRQQQTLELLQHLHEHHFVAIVGSSGSGKSSLIRAGLIPSLKAGYLIEERDKWLLATMKPGQSPLHNLVSAIVCEAKPDSDEEAIQQLLSSVHEEGADALTDYLAPVINNNTNIFLLVDQFEELFRFSADNKDAGKKNEAIDFVNILLDISQQMQLPVYIVITMRSDFIGDCAQFYGLPEAMNKSQYLVPRLSRMQLKNVITGPLAVNGAAIEQTLLNQLLNDAGDNPDQLPVLQHALMRTWEVWEKRGAGSPLSIEDYKKTGTLHAALSQHAEEAYEELGNTRLQYVCELVFKALTDKKLNARGVRRPQTFANLLLLTGATEDELRRVINTFRTKGRTFLMPSANVVLTPKTIIDISHESLMRIWTRLIQWVEEESESEQVYVRLSEAASLFKQKRGGLWRNPELELALQWKEKNNPNADWAGQINDSFEEAMAFLELSHERNVQETLDRRKEQKKRLRRARSVAAVIGVIAFVSIWLMIYAFGQKAEADHAKATAIKDENRAKQKEKFADSMKRLADESRQYAMITAKFALLDKDSALLQKERADSFSRLTAIALDKAKESEARAVDAKEKTEASERTAKGTSLLMTNLAQQYQSSELAARQSKKTSDSLAGLERSSNLANKAIDEVDTDPDSSIVDAEMAYALNTDNHGPTQSGLIYDALQTNWIKRIHHFNEFNTSKRPVRCIVPAPKNMIVIADENGVISTISFEQNRIQKINSENCKCDIRSMILSPDGNHLGIIDKDGRGSVYIFSKDGRLSAPVTFRFEGAGKKILFENNQSFIVLSTKGISTYLLSDVVVKTGFVADNSNKAIAIGESGKIYIARQDSFFIYKNSVSLARGETANSRVVFGNKDDYVTSIAVDDSERLIALGYYSGKIFVYSPFQMPPYKFQQSTITDLKFALVAGNRLQLASASADHTIKLIDVTPLTLFTATDGTPAGDDKRSRLIDDANKLRRKECIITLQGHSKWVYGLTYNSSNSFLYSCGEDNKIIAWKPTMTDLHDAINVLIDESNN